MSEELTELPPEQLDPATEAHIHMPPALVQAAQDDPEVLVKLTRGQLAVVQDRMVQKVLTEADTSLSALATVHERLSRNAKIEKADVVGGAGAAVVVNFIVGGKKEVLTIDNETGKPLDAPG